MDGRSTSHPHSNSDAGESDHLAASVLRSLGRSFHDQFSLRATDAAVGGLLTFGLLPLWRLHHQFRDYITMEKQQFWHLAEWLRVRRGSEESRALHDALKLHRADGLLSLGKFLGVAAFVGVVLVELHGRLQVRRLIDSTYQTDWLRDGIDSPVWLAWVIGLGAAYSLHAVQVFLHARRLEQVTERFNRVAVREGVAPVALPESEVGLKPAWGVAAGLLTWLGAALWAIPMALAGAMQRRYINRSATQVRTEMLDRMHAIIAQQRPAVAVPSYVIHGRRCENARCRATLRPGARFCSRCGTTSGMVSEVA